MFFLYTGNSKHFPDIVEPKYLSHYLLPLNLIVKSTCILCIHAHVKERSIFKH